MTLLIRTDFSDDAAWQRLCTVVGTPNEDGFMADHAVRDDPAHRDLTPEQALELYPMPPGPRMLAIADETTLGSAEMALLVLYRWEGQPRRIRILATKFWSIENNMSLGNMDFFEFADSVDPDGVFRGFT